jgi:hypothetical protein
MYFTIGTFLVHAFEQEFASLLLLPHRSPVAHLLPTKATKSWKMRYSIEAKTF